MRQLSIVVAMIIMLAGGAFAAVAPGGVTDHANLFFGAKAGTDSDENVWFWNPETKTVTRITATGVPFTSGTIADAIAVDADAARGIAVLADRGFAIRILTWSGDIAAEVALPDRAGDIAWMRGGLVAVTPTFAGHRIEVWDVRRMQFVQTIDPCLPVSSGPGEHVGRATLVRYDGSRDQLVALDATFGQIFVYRATGELERQLRLPAPPTPVAQWLDPASGSIAASHTFVIRRFPAITIDRDGTLWMSGGSGSDGSTRVFRSAPHSTVVEPVTTDLRACSGSLVQAWRDRLILFSHPASPDLPCASVVEPESTGLHVLYTAQVDPPHVAGTRRTFSPLQPNATELVTVCSPFTCRYMCVCPPRTGYSATVVQCGCCTVLPCNVESCCVVCDYVCTSCV